jgi:hypothetical protein
MRSFVLALVAALALCLVMPVGVAQAVPPPAKKRVVKKKVVKKAGKKKARKRIAKRKVVKKKAVK